MPAACSSFATKEIKAISWVTAICLIGDAFLYIALPLHWQAAGLSSLFEVGLVLAVNRLIRLPLNPLISLFYSRFSCKCGIVIACFLTVIATLGYGLGQGLWFWLLMRSLWGLAWTLLRLGALYSILRLGTTQTLGYLTGLYNGYSRLGCLVGMFGGGLLADSLGFTTTALIFTLCSVLAPFLSIFAVSRDPVEVRSVQQDSLRSWKKLFCTDASVFWVMMTAVVVAMTYQGVTAGTLSLVLASYGHEELLFVGLSLSYATLSGGLQSLRWIWEPILAPICGRISDSAVGRVRLTAIAFFCSALTIFLSSLPISLLFVILANIGVLLSATLLTTASDALGNEASLHSETPRIYLSAYALFTDVGAAIGPLFAYFIISLADVRVAWALTAVIMLLFALKWFFAPPLCLEKARQQSPL